MKRITGTLALAFLGLACTAPAAYALDEIKAIEVDAAVANSGELTVTETITFAGATPQTFNQALATKRQDVGNFEYFFEVRVESATLNGVALTPEYRATEDYLGFTLPTAGGSGPLTVKYTVTGAALAAADGDTVVTWDLVQGLPYPVQTVDAQVKSLAQFNMIDCAAGAAQAPAACTYYGGGTHDDPVPTFHHENLGIGEVVRATLRFPPGAVAVDQDMRERWSLDTAFSAGPWQLALVALVLLGGGAALWAAHRRFGSDAQSAQLVRVAEFHPTGEGQAEFRVLERIRPGMVGTVMDEQVDPIDVTATLLDLAVRGHLRIEELPRESAHAPTDWAFTRLPGASDELAAYEATLLTQLAPEGAAQVRVSELGGRIVPVIRQVQAQLYEDVVERGWFRRNPQQARTRWGALAWTLVAVSLLATIVLAAFTSFALVGMSLLLVAVVALFVASEMPSRTPLGVGLLQGMAALRAQLLTQQFELLPKGGEVAQVSQVLPYAVVLGGYERWLQALVQVEDAAVPDNTELGWYQAPESWQMSDLPNSLRAFIVTVQGTLFSR
ncbi:MAG: DUF2207 domain-containing protein [Propionibacteriaceae bacterium]|jgi:hypothetical protein|nr:DUF2207 domain-containing protein [Propionibacteriaceae bacterium]